MAFRKNLIIASMLLSLMWVAGCGDDDSGRETNTDDDTGTDTESDTDSGFDTDTVPDLGVCEPIIVSIPDILEPLASLDCDAFIEAAENELQKRSPQRATIQGVADSLGIDDGILDDVSFAYQAQTYALAAGLLAILDKFNLADLSYRTGIKKTSFEWYLEDLTNRRDFMYHPPQKRWVYYPAWKLLEMFNYHYPVVDVASANRYIDRLNQVDDQLACFRQNLREVAKRGLLPTQSALSLHIDFPEPDAAVPGRGELVSYYTKFASSLEKTKGLSAGQKEDLLSRALEAVETSVIPAHIHFEGLVQKLYDQAPEDGFLWQYPDGDAYYNYLLRFYAGVDIEMDAALNFGLREVKRIRLEMNSLFDKLGYPTDETLTVLYDRVTAEAGFIPQESVITTFEAIVAQARLNLSEAFDIFPVNEVIVVGGGGWYYTTSPDGIEPGEFHVDDKLDGPSYIFKSVAYHETFPGHHFQIAIDRENVANPYRLTPLTGFVEGWALYAERLAKELGWYDGDIYGDLGRLQLEMLRAVRLVTDMGIQVNEWTQEDAIAYVADTLGYSENDDFLPTAEEEVARYIRSPARVPGYKLGMKRFLELRAEAQAALGAEFDIKAFHRTILIEGAAPLPTVAYIVSQFIEGGGNVPDKKSLAPEKQRRNFAENPIRTEIN